MSTRKPNILYLTSHCPFAPSYGTQQRVLNIGRLLQKVGKVSIVIASPWNWELKKEWLDLTRKEFGLECVVRLIPATHQGFIRRIRHELDPSFINTGRYTALESDKEAMLRIMGKYDIVWVHNIKTANALGIYRWPCSVIDIDDILSSYYVSVARTTLSIREYLLNFRMSLIWRRRERLLGKRFDVIVVCSKNDKHFLGNDVHTHIIPNGYPVPDHEPKYSPVFPPRIGFIGTFGYIPNRKGVEWFVSKVWPFIKAEVPEACLRLVGKGSAELFTQLDSDIQGLGWLEDTKEEIASWSAMIVPIQMGGGTRVKIAEAFARKCPVVSTSIGAYGYEVKNGEDIFIADDVKGFTTACIRLMSDSVIGVRVSAIAWKKYLKKWSWDSYSSFVSDAVKDCLNRNR